MSEARQWPGLLTDPDPHDLPPGGAQVQTNWASLRPGRLDGRAGMREVWGENFSARGTAASDITTLADVVACYGFVRGEANYIVSMDTDGTVKAIRNPT